MKCLVTKSIINYEIYGSGFPILILHSMGTDHRAMSCWLEDMFETIQGFQRIYIDLPAHGNSTIEVGFGSSDVMLTSILDFVDKIIPTKMFSLIGFSYGGYLAQGILQHRKSSIRSICLLATALHLKDRSLPKKVVFTKDESFLSLLDNDIKVAIETLMNYQDKEHIEYFLKEIQPGRFISNKEFLTFNWRERLPSFGRTVSRFGRNYSTSSFPDGKTRLDMWIYRSYFTA